MLIKTFLSPLLGLVLLLSLSSCNEASPSRATEPTSTDTTSQNIDTYNDVTLEWNIQAKVFEVGRPHLMTDSCSFYFACDCCMAKIAFNRDGTFYDLSYCSSDQSMRSGTFTVKNGLAILSYNSTCVRRLYNWEYEFDTTVVQYSFSDTAITPVQVKFNTSKCDEKILLTSMNGDEVMVESNESHPDFISYLRKEHLNYEEVDSSGVHLSYSVLKHFSSPDSEDLFEIELTGTSIVSGTVKFSIFNANHSLIWLDEFPAVELIGHGIVGETSVGEKSDYIKNQLKNFFDSEKFGITSEADFDKDYMDRATWNELVTLKDQVDFLYSAGTEKSCRIAYVSSKEKVVRYWCCC